MTTLATILVILIAALHAAIMIAEMGFWTHARVRKSFGTTEDFARNTATLAGNQGLYNGFLVAGLVWGLVHPDPQVATQIKLFFLGCIAVAGLYGAATAKRTILFVQTVPAAMAILAVLAS